MTDFTKNRLGRFGAIYEVYSDPTSNSFPGRKSDLILFEPESGDPLWFIKNTSGTNTDISPVIRPIPSTTATAQTIGATTITAITIPVATDTSISVEFSVYGRDAGSTNEVFAKYIAAFRDNTGTLTQVNGGPALVAIVNDTGTVGGDSDVSGNDALIEVVGRGGQTWDWTVTALTLEISL